MVRAWFMDDSEEDQRLEHHQTPPAFVDSSRLSELTGVLHWEIAVETEEGAKKLAQIKEERGYTYEDTIAITKDKLPDYENKIKSFFVEHLHSDEEIRLILDGCGYFDVRTPDEKWIRIEVSKNDLLVLPAGIYHRFTLDAKNYIKANRLFIGEPVWTPINRPADDHEARITYLKSIQSNA